MLEGESSQSGGVLCAVFTQSLQEGQYQPALGPSSLVSL